MNDRFLKALRRQPVDCTPVWMMRQAGRYLPEYRAVRQQAGDFLSLCHTPELACTVALQPLARFDLDAAILFSDILLLPDAMGLGLHFVAGEGPQFSRPVRTLADIQRLSVPDVQQELGPVFETVRLLAHELKDRMPLIGFSGSPWTLATYMVEGSGSRVFERVKGLMYSEPAAMHQLLSVLTASVIDYCAAQVEAGVDVLMLFDSWGGILSTPDYYAFSLAYMQQIAATLPARVPIILFTKGGGLWLNAMADTGCSCIGLDWVVDLGYARQAVGHRVALQGSMDPRFLAAPPEKIEAEVQRILSAYGGDPGHIVNLGHGIHPDIPPEHVQVFVDAVHRFSAA